MIAWRQHCKGRTLETAVASVSSTVRAWPCSIVASELLWMLKRTPDDQSQHNQSRTKAAVKLLRVGARSANIARYIRRIRGNKACLLRPGTVRHGANPFNPLTYGTSN